MKEYPIMDIAIKFESRALLKKDIIISGANEKEIFNDIKNNFLNIKDKYRFNTLRELWRKNVKVDADGNIILNGFMFLRLYQRQDPKRYLKLKKRIINFVIL